MNAPYEITLLSNQSSMHLKFLKFDSPMKLHYSQTVPSIKKDKTWFDFPMKLHYSQTEVWTKKRGEVFDSPMKLHYSQTAGYR